MEVRPGYKKSEVGVIPNEWEVPELGCVLISVQLGGNYRNSEQESDWPLIKMGNLGRGRIRLEKVEYIDPMQRPEPRDQIEEGDVLFNTRNTLELVGKVAMWRSELPVAYFNSNIMRLAFDEDKVSSKPFMNAILNTEGFVRSLRGIATGTTSVAAIYTRDLVRLKVPLPPKREQSAIATALSDADALIESLEQLIAKKRQIKQGAMQELLTGKRRLPGFGGPWKQLRVADVVLRSFSGPSPTCEERNISGDVEWGVLKTTAITWESGWDWTKHKVLPAIFWNRRESEIEAGDVIVTKAGPRHRVGVSAWVSFVPPRILVSGKMIALRPNPERVVPLMLAAAIADRDAQSFLDQRTTGMAESQVNFENSALLDTPILLPEIGEQRAVASIVGDLELSVLSLESMLSKARALKQGMMQELLTGRIRLV